MGLAVEARRYLLVGAVGYLIDFSIFNALTLAPNFASVPLSPIWSKIISASLATMFTYAGNSRWTFKHRKGRQFGAWQLLLYGIVNVIGILLSALPLVVSRYVLGLESLAADNISANVVGVSLATVFRFLANRRFVFPN